MGTIALTLLVCFLRITEGVMEAMKFFTNVKTWSLPWPL